MVFGHIHNSTDMDFWSMIQGNPQILNAGVDVNGFQPVTLPELIENNKVFKQARPVLDGRTLKCPMSSDYDVDRMVDRIKEKLYDNASYRNVNTLSFMR